MWYSGFNMQEKTFEILCKKIGGLFTANLH